MSDCPIGCPFRPCIGCPWRGREDREADREMDPDDEPRKEI